MVVRIRCRIEEEEDAVTPPLPSPSPSTAAAFSPPLELASTVEGVREAILDPPEPLEPAVPAVPAAGETSPHSSISRSLPKRVVAGLGRIIFALDSKETYAWLPAPINTTSDTLQPAISSKSSSR